MNFNEEDFYNCEKLEAITEGAITSRQRGSDLHQVKPYLYYPGLK